mmetsp:Transcript_4806/g.8499  ORF Transcript_4806/g.8499 Transcript_4806/m.8499 type:complete len:354 (-) Transcript_4806:172-1233(-)
MLPPVRHGASLVHILHQILALVLDVLAHLKRFFGAWVHGRLNACCYVPGIIVESEHEVLEGVEACQNLSRLASSNLNNPFEDLPIVVAQGQSSDRHHLGYGAKSEDPLVLELAHVLQGHDAVLERVGDHVVQALESFGSVLRILEFVQLFRVQAPDFLWPEHPRRRLLFDVLQVITDDVCLLQEEAHVVRQLVHLRKLLALEVARSKELGETNPYQSGHVVTVEVILFLRLHLLWYKLLHPETHALRYVVNHVLKRLVERQECFGHVVEFQHELLVVSISTVRHSEVSVVNFVAEIFQHLKLRFRVQSHVVFHRIKSPEDEVEHTDGVPQFDRQLLDNDCETSRHPVEHVVAE